MLLSSLFKARLVGMLDPSIIMFTISYFCHDIRLNHMHCQCHFHEYYQGIMTKKQFKKMQKLIAGQEKFILVATLTLLTFYFQIEK